MRRAAAGEAASRCTEIIEARGLKKQKKVEDENAEKSATHSTCSVIFDVEIQSFLLFSSSDRAETC